MEIEIITNVVKDILRASGKIEIPRRSSIKLKDLFDHLTRLYGPQITERLLEDDTLRPEIIFLINGKAIEKSKVSSSKLKDGDRLAILTAMAGG